MTDNLKKLETLKFPLKVTARCPVVIQPDPSRSPPKSVAVDKTLENLNNKPVNEPVMKEKKLSRSRIIGLRLTPHEYDQIAKKCESTTCKKLSEYVRHIIFNKPITVLQRNQSLDDFMSKMMVLRTELKQVGNNFNQAVKKLQTLSQIAEFRTWIITYELEKQTVINKVDKIKNRINKIADQWLQ